MNIWKTKNVQQNCARCAKKCENYCGATHTIRNDAKEIVKVHSNEIVDRVVDEVSDEIIRKKSIVNEMPKKSEVANINKEWQDYFMELIDKAIAKRFK